LRALHVGASGARPIMGVRPDAPTNETIIPATFYELITFPPLTKEEGGFDSFSKGKNFSSSLYYREKRETN
jgi:hypothetical protein